MAMGRRGRQRQEPLWVAASEVARSPGHPFYERLNGMLAEAKFDAFAERECAQFYAEKMGRPSLAPGVYFRLLLIGYFEGIDSERGIAWRVADSLGLREFLGCEAGKEPPDHSTISRTRRRIDLETHRKVFVWVLAELAKAGLLKGECLGVDTTTLEANAAMRTIVRRDTGEGYTEYLTRLAVASGIETPTLEDLARLDRKRKNKASNDDWQHPHDPDARITKMKDGRTHLAHKAGNVMDLETGATVAVRLDPADAGDTQVVEEMFDDAIDNLLAVAEDADAAEQVSPVPGKELVGDKGFHSNDVMVHFQDGLAVRTYIAEPDRGRRNWKGEGKEAARRAVYANRGRIRRSKGKNLQRKRGELTERDHTHTYDRGGMRRTHLRGHANIMKRLLVHKAGGNLGLLMRTLFGAGTPRGLNDLPAGLREALLRVLAALWSRLAATRAFRRLYNTTFRALRGGLPLHHPFPA